MIDGTIPSTPLSMATESGNGYAQSLPGWRMEVLQSTEEIRSFQDEWERFLADAAVHHTFMAHPALVLRELDANPETFKPLFIVARNDDGVQCLAPFYVHHRHFHVRLGVIDLLKPRVRMLKAFGNRVVHAQNAPVVPALQSIFQTLRSMRGQFDTLMFFELDVGGAVWNYFQETGGKRDGFRLIPASASPGVVYLIRLPETFDAYMSAFKGTRRKALRKLVRDFEVRCGTSYSIVRVTGPAEAQAFVEDAHRLYPKTWQAQAITETPHLRPANQAFYREVAERGWYRGYALKVGDRTIAFQSGFQYKGVYHFDETGYDLEWREAGPGNVLQLKIMEDLCSYNPPLVCDFGYGEGLQKRIFANDAKEVRNVHVVPQGAVYGSTLAIVNRSANTVAQTLRDLAARMRIDGWLRERIKRGKQ